MDNADTLYDTHGIYTAASGRGADVVVPSVKTMKVSRRRSRSAVRYPTLMRLSEKGQRKWKKESGYQRQGTVEHAFVRHESIIGDWHRSRSSGAQKAEALIACNVLSRMFELGRPVSVAIRS